jgi:hypothetical protein
MQKKKSRQLGVYEAIEWTVQNRARVETIGSSLSRWCLQNFWMKASSCRKRISVKDSSTHVFVPVVQLK